MAAVELDCFSATEISPRRAASGAGARDTIQTELAALDQAWPPSILTARFPALAVGLQRKAAEMPWPAAMAWLVAHVANEPFASSSTHDRLRLASAAVSMFVHLTPEALEDGSVRLVNARRRRTVYGSYPTAPRVGEVMAKYVHAALAGATRPATILDPTIEGAPILLECSRLFAPRPDTRLVGIDIEPAAVSATRAMFVFALRSGQPYLRPKLICGDSLELLGGLGEIDALVNNPPWGERRRNAAARSAGSADPCCYFAERGLRALRPGGAFALLLPGQIATSNSGAPLRSVLDDQCVLDSITTLPAECFRRATVRSILVLGRKRTTSRSSGATLLVNYPLRPADSAPSCRHVPQSELASVTGKWPLCATLEAPLAADGRSVRLGELAAVRAGMAPYRTGRGSPRQTADTVANAAFTHSEPVDGAVPVVRSGQLRRYDCAAAVEFVVVGRHLADPADHAQTRFLQRVFVREICARDGRLVASPAPAGVVPRYGVFSILSDGTPVDPLVLCAILNSSVAALYVRTRGDGIFKESFNRIRATDLRAFPIPLSLIGRANLAVSVRRAVIRLLEGNSSAARAHAEAEIDRLVRSAYNGL